MSIQDEIAAARTDKAHCEKRLVDSIEKLQKLQSLCEHASALPRASCDISPGRYCLSCGAWIW